jgi:hypothetical protein
VSGGSNDGRAIKCKGTVRSDGEGSIVEDDSGTRIRVVSNECGQMVVQKGRLGDVGREERE